MSRNPRRVSRAECGLLAMGATAILLTAILDLDMLIGRMVLG